MSFKGFFLQNKKKWKFSDIGKFEWNLAKKIGEIWQKNNLPMSLLQRCLFYISIQCKVLTIHIWNMHVSRTISNKYWTNIYTACIISKNISKCGASYVETVTYSLRTNRENENRPLFKNTIVLSRSGLKNYLTIFFRGVGQICLM